MRLLGIILSLACLGLIGQSCQAAYVALSNGAPTTLRCADYISKGSDASWIELTDARLSYGEACYAQKAGARNMPWGVPEREYYIPVRSAGDGGKDRVKVLLKDGSEKTQRFLAKLPDDESGAAEFVQSHRDQLTRIVKVRGTVVFGLESDSDARRKLEDLWTGLAPDFVIIAAGEVPSLGRAVKLLGGSIVAGVAGVCLLGLGPIVLGYLSRRMRAAWRGRRDAVEGRAEDEEGGWEPIEPVQEDGIEVDFELEPASRPESPARSAPVARATAPGKPARTKPPHSPARRRG